jgi:hypothetical protein
VDRLEQLVRLEEGAAIRMLAKAQEAAEAGKATDARNFSVAHGIHVDKAAALGQRLDRGREDRVRLAEGQGKLLAEVVRAYFAALGLEAHRGLLRGLLEQVSAGQALSASPTHVAEARRELVETLAIEIRARLPDLEPSWEPRGPLGLPAPRGDEDTASEPLRGDSMIGPIRRVRTFTERRIWRSQGRSNGTGSEVVEPSEVHPPAVEGHEANVEREDERASAPQETAGEREREARMPMAGDLYRDPERWRWR